MRRVKWSVIFLGIVLFSFCSQNSFPQTTDDMRKEIEDLKQRLAQLEQKLEQQEQKISGQEQKIGEQGQELVEHKETRCEWARIKEVISGIGIGADATFIVQSTNNANGDDLSRRYEDATDASYSIDLGFEKKFDDYGMAFLHLETGDGAGVEDDLKVFSNVNRDADDSDNNISLTEAWYEHYFKTLPLTLTLGKIDTTCYIDTNEYANCECTQFLGHMFRNSPVLGFPDDNSAGVRFLLEPADFVDIETVVADAYADWDSIFDHLFVSSQLNIKPKLFNRPGNYRVYGWMNDKEHTKWMKPDETKTKSYGVGLSFDQELTDLIGVFARYGWQDPKVFANGEDFSLEQSWSAGLQLKGTPWGRQDDVIACALGQIFASDDYKKVNVLRAKSEKHLEAYYSLRINDHLALTPDVHVIWDPYGDDAVNGDKTILVGGMRTQVDF